MKFLKIENKILNVEQIKSVTENLVTVGYSKESDDLPFGDPIKEVCGIMVHMINSSEFEYFVFESETIESFYEKFGGSMKIKEGGGMEDNKLWAVNIPEEPDSEEILYPVPSKELGEQIVQRLRKEAIETFETVGECIAEAVTLEEWDLSADEHSKYLEENPNWWDETTFLDDEVA